MHKKKDHTIEPELWESMPRRVRYTAATKRKVAAIYLVCAAALVLALGIIVRAMHTWEALRQHGVAIQARTIEASTIVLKETDCNTIFEFRVGSTIVRGSEQFRNATCSSQVGSDPIEIVYLPQNPHIYAERYLVEQSPSQRVAYYASGFLMALGGCAIAVALGSAGFRRPYRLLQNGDTAVGRVVLPLIKAGGRSVIMVYEFPISGGRTQRISQRVPMRYARLCAEGEKFTVLRDRTMPERSLPYFLLRQSVAIAKRKSS